jgi:glycosyltransferase involved in cell wall biosynthesis/SAM-dependent methyltransferase
MKIGFDISQTGSSKAGCGYFAENLIQGLAQIDTANEYILYPTFGDVFWEPDKSSLVQINQPNFRRGPLQRSLEEMEIFWNTPPADFAARIGYPDIIHANNFFCPIAGAPKAQIIYTLYDMAFVDLPELTTESNRIACFDGMFRASLYADRIIAISEYSRQRFLEMFPHYPADHVVVIYPASRFSRQDSLLKPHLLAQFQPEQFFLSVGTLEPRKNYLRLLHAYARLKTYRGSTLPLVLAGGKGWLMDDFEQTMDRLGLRQDVILLGYVDNPVLHWLYQNCFAFVYPSLYEGFGLPVLEAMSLGAAVITSNVTSLPELVSDAGILIDPLREEEIYGAMLNLIEEGSSRDNLKRRALARASLFSWENTARQVIAQYEETQVHAPLSRTLAHDLPSALQSVSASWEHFGEEDPPWDVLTWPEKKGGKWKPEEFFAVGQHDIEALLQYLDSLGVKINMGGALDFGCGAGRLTQALGGHFTEVHGVDISASMIETAKNLNQNPAKCFFHLNKADDLRIFDEDTFDFVLTLITLQHVPRQYAVKYIAEFARVLKPGGVMVFQVPASRRDAHGNPLQPSIPEQSQPTPVTNDSVMIMAGIPYSEVVRTLTESGAQLIDAVEDQSAGPEWLSYRYCAVKQK